MSKLKPIIDNRCSKYHPIFTPCVIQKGKIILRDPTADSEIIRQKIKKFRSLKKSELIVSKTIEVEDTDLPF